MNISISDPMNIQFYFLCWRNICFTMQLLYHLLGCAEDIEDPVQGAGRPRTTG